MKLALSSLTKPTRFLATTLTALMVVGCAQVLGLGDYRDGAGGSGSTGTSTGSSGSGTVVTATSTTGSTGSGEFCGNGLVGPQETCDQNCPTECIDNDLCTSQGIQGSPTSCDVVCPLSPIVACKNSDGCCPTGCISGNDNDCAEKVLVITSEANFGSGAPQLLKFVEPAFGTVDYRLYDGTHPAPTAADLAPYAAILVYLRTPFPDHKLLGDLLADYQDGGGRVVLGAGANCGDAFRIRGRFNTEGYILFADGAGVLPTPIDFGMTLEPQSPLMNGVQAFPSQSVHCDATLIPGALSVATYTDGRPLVARGLVHGHVRVDLNFMPNFNDTSLWKLVANALRYPRD